MKKLLAALLIVALLFPTMILAEGGKDKLIEAFKKIYTIFDPTMEADESNAIALKSVLDLAVKYGVATENAAAKFETEIQLKKSIEDRLKDFTKNTIFISDLDFITFKEPVDTVLLDTDTKSLTTDELIQLKNQVNMLLAEQNYFKEYEVPIGTWTVGEDIPAGKWEIKPTEKGGMKVIIYKDNNYTDKYDYIFREYIPSNENAVQELKTGNIVIIEDRPAVLVKFSGLNFD